MKFSIEQEQLLQPLQTVGGIVDRRATTPILGNFLLRLTPESLSITGTDRELEMIMHIDIDDSEPGEMTLPARKLIDICRSLPAGSRIDISQQGERAIIRSGRSRFTLATLPPDQFPELKEPEVTLEFSITQEFLKQLIDNIAFSMAAQDVRYFLNGVCLEVGSHYVRGVATDGHRLAFCSLSTERIDTEEDHRVIVPRKAALELTRLLDGSSSDPLRVQIGENHIRFLLAGTGTVFSSKLIDGQYPDYLQVIPEGNRNELIADREALLVSLRRVSILSNEKLRSVRLSLGEDGILRIAAHNQEQEEAEEELEVRYEGVDLEIAFNVQYLIDVLQAIRSDEVRFLFGDGNSSCLVVNESGDMVCRYVIMPMRL